MRMSHEDSNKRERANLEVLTRIISLETKLAVTIEKLDRLVDSVEEKLNQFAGDANTPSVTSRILNLESFNRTIRWSIGLIYTGLIGLIIAYIKEKI